MLLLILGLAVSGLQAALRHHNIKTYDQVEYLVSDSNNPPDNSAAWQTISLPDNWALSRPGFKGRVWYRIRFNIPGNRPRSRAVYIPRNNANHYVVYINFEKRGGNRSDLDPNLTDLHRPLIHGRAGYRPGENVVHIRLDGDARYRHGLSRVTIGPPRLVRPQYYQSRYDLQVTSIAAFGATMLLAGLLALLVWHGERRNPVMFWFGMVALSWSLCTYLMIWPPHVHTEAGRQLLIYMARHLYAVPLLVLCLRIGNVHQRALEQGLWLLFVSGMIAAVSLDVEHFITLAMLSWSMFLFLSIGFFGWLLWVKMKLNGSPEVQRDTANESVLRFRTRERSTHFLPVSLMVVIGFTAHDWARWLGYVDYDNMLLTPFAMPFLILALGGAIISSHIQAANALARSNVELEERVTDKARELEKVYEQMQLSQREQAVLQERQRIMGDMHDGLSANLVSLYNMVQSNNTDSTEVAYRLDETLRELRAIVDSLEPVEGDLGVVLGNIRYRMRTALEESGINLIWRVEELPTLADLKPEKILNIQRIVLEALTNALRHAAADTVSVSARAIAEENIIIITITDNGTGFDTSTTQGGRGLRNMHDRAMRIGIILHIDSKPGQGTTITLKLPITHN